MSGKVSVIKKLVGNIGFVVVLNLLIKPVWLVLENKIQNEIGHQDYGTFVALFAFTYVFGVFSDLGLNQFTTKQLASSPNFKETYLPVLFPLKWLFTGLFPLIILGGGYLIGYNRTELYYLLILAFGFGLTQFIFYLRALFQGGQHFNYDAVASVGERLVLLFLVFGLFWYGLTLESYVYVRTLAILLTFLILYGLVFKLFGQYRYQFNWLKIKYLFKASFPFAVITLVYGINERIDMVMLERLASSREAGIYAAAYRWVDAVMMYLWTILPIFFARFAATIPEKEQQQKLLNFGQVIVAVPIIYVAVFTFFYGRLLFWQFSNSTPTELNAMLLNLQILFGNVLVHGFFAIYGTLLSSSNYEKAISFLAGITIMLNLTLNTIFIPVYGSLAASVNTLVCAVFVSGGYLVLTRRRMKIAIPVGMLIKLIVAAGLLVAAFKLLSYFLVSWMLIAGLAGLIYIGLLFILRVINIHDVKAALLQNKK